MLLSQIDKILVAIQKFTTGDIQLWELAHDLEMPLDHLEVLLSWNNVLDGQNHPHPYLNYQDIVNVITLYFAMKPTHEFKFTVFGDPKDGYVKTTHERMTTQQYRVPHTTRQGGRKPPG